MAKPVSYTDPSHFTRQLPVISVKWHQHRTLSAPLYPFKLRVLLLVCITAVQIYGKAFDLEP